MIKIFEWLYNSIFLLFFIVVLIVSIVFFLGNETPLISFLIDIFDLAFFPFYIVYTAIKYMDIIYLSLSGFFILMFISLYLIDKYHEITIFNFLIIFLLIGSFTSVSSYYEAESYIKKFAKEKYNVTALRVKINLPAWWPMSQFYTHRDEHAVIGINDKLYYWSFKKRDFVKD